MKISAQILGLASAALLGLLPSCDLTHKPSDLIPFEESFKTLSDLKKWDNGIYSTLRGKMGGAFVLPQEVQADMLNAHAGAGSYTAFYTWNMKANDATLSGLYQAYYAALVDVNLVLLNANKVQIEEGGEAAAKKEIARYKGDAHFARAFYYFNLAMRWGMPYKAETASTDLAVPYVVDLTPLELLPRATNEVIWGGILSDLEKAGEYLSDIQGKEGSDEITADAVTALRARVYYYMDMPEKALAEAEKLIASKTYPLITPLAEPLPEDTVIPADEDPFVLMWQRDSGKEQIWQPHIEKPNELTNTTDLYGADLTSQQFWEEQDPAAVENYNNPGYLPTGEAVYNLFENGDRRGQAYFEFAYTTVNGSQNRYGYIAVVSKFKGNPAYRDMDSKAWGGYVPTGLQAPKPFRIAEQYLIAAETALETEDAAKALGYLRDLRASRGLDTRDIAGEELMKAIREERARELAFEGFRLWDLRKWNEGFKRGMTQKDSNGKTDFLNNQLKHDIEIEAGNPLFIWGFPTEEARNINPRLKQNEGW